MNTQLTRSGHPLAVVLIILLILFNISWSQQRLERERWGEFGVGKLVTRMSNTNNIGSGQLALPQIAKFPAFEYPYNPNREGRRIDYAVGVSFHVGGFSQDRGPAWTRESESLDDPSLESGDQAHYRFYQGFHYDGFPGFIPPASTDPKANLVAVSNDSVGWPLGSWPATYPTSDPVLDNYFPDYPTAYSTGILTPIPLPLDHLLGFPGAGPNKHSAPGRYYPGQVVADQESFTVSFAKNRDDDEYQGHLMIYTSLRGLSWKGDLAEDILFWIYTVTNIGTEPIDTTYMGVFADFDFPWASYRAYGTYSETDCYAFDTYDTDTESGDEHKIGYGWDGDGYVAGAVIGDWAQQPAKLTDETEIAEVALAGLIFLQTPLDTMTGQELGITSWDAFDVSKKGEIEGIGNTIPRFYWLNVRNTGQWGGGTDPDDPDGDRIDNWTWEQPFPVGSETLYYYGKKGGMTMNTGPFQLAPGETDTLICATIMGVNRADLFKNAKMARQIFTSGWMVPKGPFEPRLVVKAESQRVTLRWGTLSENDSLNVLYGRQTFEGYKIYRSEDGGATWGTMPITDENGTVIDYVPAGQYDLANGVTGASPIMPSFNRGSDSGLEGIAAPTDSLHEVLLGELGRTIVDTLRYVYVDTDVLNGFSYQYAVIAYGAGDEDPTGLPPLQNPRTSGPNVITIVPRSAEAVKKNDLEEVKVVPNPYRVYNPQESAVRERMIKFTHLPQACTIRIFNVSGELIVTLDHDANSPVPSEQQWNLRSMENLEVAPGLYFFHLESVFGATSGKFVIIK
ncbi:MAG: hypothetical protein JSU61_11375 [Fidelibacterota bacterium]|nr:MAG: hypothetical protein JSU61_11375 [Candidatus Neomarinimicrobiota bacterium]